jgi:hypothetical protein
MVRRLLTPRERDEARAIDHIHPLRSHGLPQEEVIGDRPSDEPEPRSLGLLGRSLCALSSDRREPPPG